MTSANMNNFKGAIFDCDGTLLDSLGAWRGLEGKLEKLAHTKITPEQRALFATFTIAEVAQYVHENFGVGASNADVVAIMDEYMMDYYAHKATIIPGVLPFLEDCARAGVRMCVVSSSAQAYLRAGLASCGIDQYFSDIISVEDFDTTKREPLVFEKAQDVLGTSRAETWGIDDSLYALETLERAGFPAIGVCNEINGVPFEEIKRASQVAVERLDELTVKDGKLQHADRAQ